MSLAGMTTVLKRVLTLGLMLAFLVGVTAQAVPCGMGQADTSARADMGAACAEPDMPCPGHLPACIDHVGCLTVPAIPTSPASLAVVFEWTSPTYDFAAVALSGISIKPELSPPILAA